MEDNKQEVTDDMPPVILETQQILPNDAEINESQEHETIETEEMTETDDFDLTGSLGNSYYVEVTQESKVPAGKPKMFKTKRITLEEFLGEEKQSSSDMSIEQVSCRGSDLSKESIYEHYKNEEPEMFVDDVHKKMAFTVVRKLFVRPNKFTTLPTRFIKMTANKQRPFQIIENGIDYTPKRCIDENDPRWLDNPLLMNFPRSTIAEIKPDDFIVTGNKPLKHEIYEDNMSIKLDVKLESSGSESDLTDGESYEAPLMYPLKFPEPEKINTLQIVFKLKETETITLLTLTSRAADINDEEGESIIKANEMHETVNNRLRKKMDTYCQTSTEAKQKSKSTQLLFENRANKYSVCSIRDIYDAIVGKPDTTQPEEEEHEVGKVKKIVYAETESKSKPIMGEAIAIEDSSNWYKTAMIIERLLLSNNAMKQQIMFHDYPQTDPLSGSVQFSYKLHRLWTWKPAKTERMAVTCLSWNKHDKNILAAGYGKFNFTDPDMGAVSIWNTKNLAQPERHFSFPHSVTSIRFCYAYPDILAISFYSGWVILVNIVRNEPVKVIAKNMPFTKTSVCPVWDITWKRDLFHRLENIIECKGDGCVYEYTKRHLHVKRLIMKISKMKGKIKGISYPKKCQPYVIPVVRNPAILCITAHPDDPSLYYLGTDEGGIYKCTVLDLHQYVDMFMAHNGPVYKIRFHPACSKIFLTCGADWCIRIWGDGISTPLITMKSGTTAVTSASWCPTQPTIIVSLTDTRIELWDISRRLLSPQACYENLSQEKNTTIRFSKNGNTFSVGDKAGNVHIFSMSNMPFTPTNSDMVLALILIKALTPNRKLLNELYKLGPPFNVPRIYKNYLNLS